jgi:transcriptional regulator with XRE-family HTH domain
MQSFNISRKILGCRREKGVTQEELADFIGVSKASVSKWETGHSFPDITILPLLASYFDISIDELMGYEPQMSKSNIKKTYIKLSKDFSEKSFDEVIDSCEEIIRRYFSCYPLLFQIATLYLNNSNLAGDMNKTLEIISRSSQLFNKVRIDSNDANLIKQSVLMEAFCLVSLNEPQNAIDLLSENNNEVLSSASLLSRAYQMIGETEKATQTIQIEIYQFLITLLQLLQSYLPLLSGNEKGLRDILNKYQDIVKVFNIKKLRPDLMASFDLVLSQEFMKLGNTNEALHHLTEYTNVVTGNIYPLELRGDEFFTLIENWINDFPIGSHTPRDENLIRESMYRAVADNPIYKDLKENNEFKTLLRRLKNNSNNSKLNKQ